MADPRLHAVVVTFQVRPEAASAFEALLAENAAASMERENGCIQFDICRRVDEPASFLLYELYESQQAFSRHLQTSHFMQFDAAAGSMVVAKDVQVLERVWPA